MSNAFNGEILAEKLSKLNNSQQSIETLSHWCIFHRKKAKQVVETWGKLFNGSEREQRIPFLYLANDILQNSRRKGSEFVNSFWKVLPGALKDVSENGGDHGKNVVSRLVEIWEERKVFGSRGRSLKDEMLAKDPPPLLESNGKSSHSIKIVRKDAHSIRLKLAVGGMPEKIVTAFQSVHDEHFNEDTALNKCKAAVRRVGKMEKDVDDACTRGNQQGSTLLSELQEQETILRQCIEQLECAKATRASLVGQLKEAVHDQELKLELIHTQLQVAQAQIDQASSMKQRLSSVVSGPILNTTTPFTEPVIQITPTPPPQPPPPLPITSFASPKAATEDQHKRSAAAAMAAKLAASASSAQMLSSVLSSLVAEEAAAATNGGPKNGGFTSSLPAFSPEKRPKLEKPMPVSDTGSNYYFSNVQPQSQPQQQIIPQTNQSQPSSYTPPPLPPLPPPPMQQYVQSSGMILGVMPYGYNNGGTGLPPPPPLHNNMVMGLAKPGPLQPPQQQQHQHQQQQQQQLNLGYYQPGMGYYGQSHQPAAPPPLPRP